MVKRIYPHELQLYKAKTSDTDFPILDLHLSNGFVLFKIYHKRDDFDCDIVNFPDVEGDTSYGVYISQLIRYARVCSHVDDFNIRYKCLIAKLLKINVGLKSILIELVNHYANRTLIVSCT